MTCVNYIFIGSMWKSSLKLFRNEHLNVLLCNKAFIMIDLKSTQNLTGKRWKTTSYNQHWKEANERWPYAGYGYSSDDNTPLTFKGTWMTLRMFFFIFFLFYFFYKSLCTSQSSYLMQYDFYSWLSLPLSFMHWLTRCKPPPRFEPGSPAWETDHLPIEL